MNSKKKGQKKEKEIVLSVGEITKMGMNVFSKVLKTADDVKRSKLTIRLEKD